MIKYAFLNFVGCFYYNCTVYNLDDILLVIILPSDFLEKDRIKQEIFVMCRTFLGFKKKYRYFKTNQMPIYFVHHKS